MTREVKIGTGVAGSFLSLVAVVVGTKMYKGEVPKTVDGAIAAVASELKKDDAPKPAPPPAPPGPLTLTSGDTLPLPTPGSISPPPAPAFGAPGELPSAPKLPAFPPATTGEVGFPAAPDFAPVVDAGKDIAKNLADQKARQEAMLREAIEKQKKDATNFGNTLIDGAKKNVDQFSSNLQDKTKDALNSLPSLPALPPGNPGTISFPPAPGGIEVADNTILGGGAKKPNPVAPLPNPSAPPAPPAPPSPPFGGGIPEPKTIVGGSTPPSPPPAPAPAPLSGGLPGIPEPKAPTPFGGVPEAPKTIMGGSTPPSVPIPGPPVDPFAPAPMPNPAFNSQPPQPIPGPGSVQPVPVSGSGNTNPNAAPWNPPPRPADPLVAPTPPVTPIVRTDSPDRYQCQGNENYALIAARKYNNDGLARALEEYNRDLPGAAENVRAQPPRLQQGTIVFLPSQNYLTERYSRFIATSGGVPPAPPFGSPPPARPFGNDIGLSQPTPPKQPSPPTQPVDAGVTSYRVPTGGMYLSQVAERQLGSALRWIDIYRLNPGLQPEQPLREGIEIRVPAK